jgi:hypothetical protein
MSDATKATPVPTPVEFDPETGELTHGGMCLGFLHDVDDFPCLDADETDFESLQAVIDATGRKLAAAYNAHDAMVELAREVAKEYEDAADWKDAYGRLNRMATAALANAQIP